MDFCQPEILPQLVSLILKQIVQKYIFFFQILYLYCIKFKKMSKTQRKPGQANTDVPGTPKPGDPDYGSTIVGGSEVEYDPPKITDEAMNAQNDEYQNRKAQRQEPLVKSNANTEPAKPKE